MKLTKIEQMPKEEIETMMRIYEKAAVAETSDDIEFALGISTIFAIQLMIATLVEVYEMPMGAIEKNYPSLLNL